MQLNQINHIRKLQLSYIQEINNETPNISKSTLYLLLCWLKFFPSYCIEKFPPKIKTSIFILKILANSASYLLLCIDPLFITINNVSSKPAICQSSSQASKMKAEIDVTFKVGKKIRFSNLTLFCSEKQSELQSSGRTDA